MGPRLSAAVGSALRLFDAKWQKAVGGTQIKISIHFVCEQQTRIISYKKTTKLTQSTLTSEVYDR